MTVERRKRKRKSTPRHHTKRRCRTRRVKIMLTIIAFLCCLEIGGIRNARQEHKRLRTRINLKLETQLSGLLEEVQIDLFGDGASASENNKTTKLQALETIEEIEVDTREKPALVDENGEEILVRGGLLETIAPVGNSSANTSQPLQIPATLQYLEDLSVPYNKLTDTPLFWHIPKAGGTSIKHMYSECYSGLVVACESGISEGHQDDKELQVVTMENGWKFMNVDVSTQAGLYKAQTMNLVKSRQAEIIVTPLLHEATSMLFSHANKARLFLMIRHPLERVLSLFYYLKTATHEPTYNPIFQHMTLDEYANSTFVESNFIARALANRMTGQIFPADYDIARSIMRKSIVGLLENIEESTRRFDQYFGFEGSPSCKQSFLSEGTNRGKNRQEVSLPSPTSFAFQELARKNFMDMRLYKEAKILFQEQASMFTPSQGKIGA